MAWVQIVMMVAAMVLAEQEKKQQRKHRQKQLAAQEARAKAQKKLQMKQAQDAHKKRQAQLRAKMGASGVGFGGGSSDAVLQGLQKKSRANLLTISAGAQMQGEMRRLNAGAGVREGLKQAQTHLNNAAEVMAAIPD